MGSVISEINCPKCDYEFAFVDMYYRTGDEYLYCERCGFDRKFEVFYDDKGHPIKAREDSRNCGHATRIEYENGMGEHGSISHRYFRKYIDAMQKEMQKDAAAAKVVEASITFKRGGEWYALDILTGKAQPFVDKYRRAELRAPGSA